MSKKFKHVYKHDSNYYALKHLEKFEDDIDLNYGKGKILILAASRNEHDMLSEFLTRGADENLVGVLISAVLNNSKECVQVLLDRGMSVLPIANIVEHVPDKDMKQILLRKLQIERCFIGTQRLIGKGFETDEDSENLDYISLLPMELKRVILNGLVVKDMVHLIQTSKNWLSCYKDDMWQARHKKDFMYKDRIGENWKWSYIFYFEVRLLENVLNSNCEFKDRSRFQKHEYPFYKRYYCYWNINLSICSNCKRNLDYVEEFLLEYRTRIEIYTENMVL